MIVLEDRFDTRLEHSTYAALGSFDGLHLGHMELIKKTLELSRKNNAKSMVYTFKNHPLTVISRQLAPKLLMNNDLKLHILRELGVDIASLVAFDDVFMRMSPEDFIKNMINSYNIKGIVVGYNYKFGFKNQGNINLLKEMSVKLGFELYVINSVNFNDKSVSSSRIRELISQGNVYDANQMLCKPYMLQGKVIKGKQLGRTIGFPTANLQIDNNFVIPNKGVYYTIVEYNNNQFKGITNVGYNPTVHGDSLTIETFILNFNKDIYGDELKVYFIEKFREELKFNSLQDLSKQLLDDVEYAKKQKIEIIS